MSAIVENAVGGLIANEVDGVIRMVLSRITAEIKLAWGFKKELEDLQGELTRLGGLLQGASSHPITNTNPLIADWLKMIKDVAYDADDLLDEWSYAAIEARVRTRKWDNLIRGVSKPFCRLHMAHKARDLTNLISNIYSDANRLGIRPIQVAAGEVYTTKHSHQSQDRETRLRNQRHYVDEKLFIGRDEDIAHLVKLLCDPSTNNSSLLTVIGIVGMAGLGKTTFCKRISKVQEVIEFFNSMVFWLVISRNFDLLDVLNRMVETLFKESSNMRDRQALISRLGEKLEGRRYLLILDDIWDTIDWESLNSTLQEIGGAFGAVVLVTSRDKDVVGKMVTNCYDSKDNLALKRPSIYTLQGLSEGDSWSLFMARISDDNLVGNEKELIARRMMKKCGGVPLAIRALGDLLRDKSIGRWKEIEKSHLWTNVDKNEILPSLRLSYDYLPCTSLKKCFAYCAIFEEDEIIEKHRLIHMWMAQDFLHPYVEDKGEEYIEHLLNSSLFQEEERDKLGNVKTFKMHDLAWSLAQVVLNGDETSNEVRHLVVPEHFKSRGNTLTCYTKLRTYLLFEQLQHPSLRFLLKCRQLRVLRISLCYRSANLDWEPLGSLIHLRYFEISVANGLVIMQSNFAKHLIKLYHLQTLCIQNRVMDPYKICYPREIGNLVNLRHILDDDDIGIPVGLGHLTALQTLPTINLERNWGGRLSDVGLLTNLRGTLEIQNLHLLSVEEEARGLLVGNKSYLDSLSLKWDSSYPPVMKENPHTNEILEALQPNTNLKMLEIFRYNGTRFPRWLVEGGGCSSLSNLISLSISCSKGHGDLKLNELRSLQFLKLQSCKKLSITGFQCCKSLQEVVLDGCYKVGDVCFSNQIRSLTMINNQVVIIGSSGSLPCLKELHTDELQLVAQLGEDTPPVCNSLEMLTLQNVVPDELRNLKMLQCLTIDDCPSLETLPDWIANLTSLRELSLYRMPKLRNLPSQDAMRNLYNLKSFNLVACPLLPPMKGESGLKLPK